MSKKKVSFYTQANVLDRGHFRVIESLENRTINRQEHPTVVFKKEKGLPDTLTLWSESPQLTHAISFLGSDDEAWAGQAVTVLANGDGNVWLIEGNKTEYVVEEGLEQSTYEKIQSALGCENIFVPCGMYGKPSDEDLEETPEDQRRYPVWKRKDGDWTKWSPKIPATGYAWQNHLVSGSGANRWLECEDPQLPRRMGVSPLPATLGLIDVDVKAEDLRSLDLDVTKENFLSVGKKFLAQTLEAIGTNPVAIIPSNSPGGCHIYVHATEESKGNFKLGDTRCGSGQAVLWKPEILLEGILKWKENPSEYQAIDWDAFHKALPLPGSKGGEGGGKGHKLEFKTLDEAVEAFKNAPNTHRHDTCIRNGNKAYRLFGVSANVTETLVKGFMAGAIGARYGEDGIRDKLKSCADYVLSNASDPLPANAKRGIKLQQSLMSDLFENSNEPLRYRSRTRTPYLWLNQSRVWIEDERIISDRVAAHCEELEGYDEKGNIVKYDGTFVSGVAKRVMDRSTRRPINMDANPDILGLPNGRVADLKTGEIRKAEPDDLLSLSTAVSPKETETPEWDKFLEQMTLGDKQIESWLRRWIGYSLTGRNDEEAACLLKGEGSNGKGTFLSVIRGILGGYSALLPSSVFKMAHKEMQEQIAKLHRKRALVLGEASRGFWDAQTFNLLSEGGEVTARHLYGHPFDVQINGKLIVGVNRTPKIGSDNSIERRLRVVPCDMILKIGEQDLGLKMRLKTEFSGILFDAIREATQWYKEGMLPMTYKMRTAVEEWLESSASPYEKWLEENAITGESHYTEYLQALYVNFKAYLESSGSRPISRPKFQGLLADTHGVAKGDKDKKGIPYYGIQLRAPSDPASRPAVESAEEEPDEVDTSFDFGANK